jgi:hypothetical protein
MRNLLTRTVNRLRSWYIFAVLERFGWGRDRHFVGVTEEDLALHERAEREQRELRRESKLLEGSIRMLDALRNNWTMGREH